MVVDTEFIHFIVTVALSFLIGLEVRSYKDQFHLNDQKVFFGSVRTFAFVGILGFITYKIDPKSLLIYTTVLITLSIIYAVFYYHKLQANKSSILLYLLMVCVYTVGPLTEITPLWMPSLLFVLIVFILNARKSISSLLVKINANELETLGKMILLSAVILPLLPNQKIIPYIPLSPFKIWLAVVVISAISYGGYIAQKYLFPNKGYFVTGIIGGTYSSTATTVVLARKIKSINKPQAIIDASIIAATSMMYIRLIAVAFIFNFDIGKSILLPFATLALIGSIISFVMLQHKTATKVHSDFVDSNPLEIGTALIFASLFVIMMVATHFVTQNYGLNGLEILSFIVGFTDIDPFVLSLLTGKYSIPPEQLTASIMIAAGSNNLLKAIYALWFGGIKNAYRCATVITLLGIATIVWALIIEGYF